MKTDIHEASISSLIVLFAIMAIGGGFYIYPKDITGVNNEATPSSFGGFQNPSSNSTTVTNTVSTTTTTDDTGTTTVEVETNVMTP